MSIIIIIIITIIDIIIIIIIIVIVIIISITVVIDACVMATGGVPGLQGGRCLAGSPADETGPPLLLHLLTHPPDHL